MNHISKIHYGVLLILLISIVLNGFLLFKVFFPASKEPSKVEVSSPSAAYPFLSKRILNKEKSDIFISFNPLRQAVKEYISKQQVENIRFYFEYLPSGISIGVNEQTETPSGSLVKIPTVLAVYKKIEEGKLDENHLLSMRQEDIDTNFGEFYKQGVGTTITIKEAIRLALTQSDNTAHNMLYQVLNENEIRKAYDNLDINFEIIEGKDRPVVTAKSYASNLKSLYFATHLNEYYSSKVLDLLTQTPFNTGIPTGVDPKIKIAHKIGVQAHLEKPLFADCGIIYVPNRPYLLCMLVEGEREAAFKHLQALSRMVYGYIIKIQP